MLIKESYFKKVLKQEFRKLFEAATPGISLDAGYTNEDFAITMSGQGSAALTAFRTSAITQSSMLADLMFEATDFAKNINDATKKGIRQNLMQIKNPAAVNGTTLGTYTLLQNDTGTDRVFINNYNNGVGTSAVVLKNYVNAALKLNTNNYAAPKTAAAPAAQTASPAAAPASPAASPAAQTAATASAAPTAQTIYTIKRGDTVATIIQKNYGFNPRAWNTLTTAEKQNLMRIFATRDLDKIKAGAQINLPGRLNLGNKAYSKTKLTA